MYAWNGVQSTLRHSIELIRKDLLALLIPLATLFECHAFTTEDVKCAANRQVKFATTQPFHKLKILNVSSTASIRDRNGADIC